MFKLFLLLNPVYVTLFWAVVLNTVKPRGNEPKAFLGKFFVVEFLLYLSHLFFFLPLPEIYHFAEPFYHLFSLLVPPLYYIYVRMLAIDRYFSWKKHAKYLIVPFTLFVFYGAGVLCMSKAEHIDYMYDKIIEGKNVTGIFLYQKIVYFVIRTTFIVQGILYLTLSILTVRKNRENVENFYSNTEADSLRNVQRLNITVVVGMTAGIVASAIGKESFVGSSFSLIAPSVIFTVMLFAVGWLGNRQRAVLLTDIAEENENATVGEDTDKGEDTKSQNIHVKNRLEKLFNEEQTYLNKDLTIWELARKLGTNRTYLSQIINTDYGQNFSAFVNSYRVCHAKKLQQSRPELSQAEIADLSGFGSVKSWRRAVQ